MPGCETTRVIFILRQLQKKYSAENKNFYCTFVELELAFDRVPRDAIWWVLKKLGIEKWLVKIVQSMHRKARSCVGINESFSNDFLLQVELHQGSVLSPLLLIACFHNYLIAITMPWQKKQLVIIIIINSQI